MFSFLFSFSGVPKNFTDVWLCKYGELCFWFGLERFSARCIDVRSLIVKTIDFEAFSSRCIRGKYLSGNLSWVQITIFMLISMLQCPKTAFPFSQDIFPSNGALGLGRSAGR